MKILLAKKLLQYVLDHYIIEEYYFHYYKQVTKIKIKIFLFSLIKYSVLQRGRVLGTNMIAYPHPDRQLSHITTFRRF